VTPHLFTMGGDDYEFMTPRCFTYLRVQPVAESCTIGAHFIVTSLIFDANKSFVH